LKYENIGPLETLKQQLIDVLKSQKYKPSKSTDTLSALTGGDPFMSLKSMFDQQLREQMAIKLRDWLGKDNQANCRALLKRIDLFAQLFDIICKNGDYSTFICTHTKLAHLLAFKYDVSIELGMIS